MTEDGSDEGIGFDSDGREFRTDVFTVEIMSAWGDTWVWNDVATDDVMGVYESLGDPAVFYRLGDERTERDDGRTGD